jgi:hypothetical protein
MWKSENCKDKRLLLEMYFEEKLAYDLKEGFGTATLAPLFKLLRMKEASENHLVDKRGNTLNQIEEYIWKWYQFFQNKKI